MRRNKIVGVKKWKLKNRAGKISIIMKTLTSVAHEGAAAYHKAWREKKEKLTTAIARRRIKKDFYCRLSSACRNYFTLKSQRYLSSCPFARVPASVRRVSQLFFLCMLDSSHGMFYDRKFQAIDLVGLHSLRISEFTAQRELGARVRENSAQFFFLTISFANN